MQKYLLALSLLIASCSYHTVTFTTYNDPKTHQLKIPAGFILTKKSYENENAFTYEYPDKSRIFFSDNIHPSSFYPDAYQKYGNNLNLLFITNDTVTISGVDSSGRYWQTRKMKNIVYGYMQVLSERKQLFDSILNRLINK